MSREEKIADLIEVLTRLKRSLHRHMIEGGICQATPAQAEVLSRIARGENRASDIAAAMGSSASAITQHINQLVEHGFVKKTDSPSDKRELILHLTVAGEHAIQVTKTYMRSRFEQAVSVLSDAELDQFIMLSSKIARQQQREEKNAS